MLKILLRVFIIAKITCVHYTLLSQIPEKLELGSIEIKQITYYEPIIGENTCYYLVINKSDSVKNIFISNRIECSSGNSQKGRYYALEVKDTIKISVKYYIEDETCSLLKVNIYIPDEIQTFPNDKNIVRLASKGTKFTHKYRFHINLNFKMEESYYWTHKNVQLSKIRLNEIDDFYQFSYSVLKDSIKKVLKWDRVGSNNYNVRKIESIAKVAYYVNDHINIETWQLQGEKDNPIDFLLMQMRNVKTPFKTLLFLSGNPTGIKEDQMGKLLPLVHAGYRVAAIDRRESARKTESGEFLNNISDPVFDAKHLVDYLASLNDTDTTSGIGIMGFSQGAAESMFIAALHKKVTCAILVCRMIDNDYLFNSEAWWPTLYNPDVLRELGADSILTKTWDEQFELVSQPVIRKHAKQIYNRNWVFYDSKIILKLVAPKPLLIISGALDAQFPIEGVLALDNEIMKTYNSLGFNNNYNIYIDPRSGHKISPIALRLIIEYLSLWM